MHFIVLGIYIDEQSHAFLDSNRYYPAGRNIENEGLKIFLVFNKQKELQAIKITNTERGHETLLYSANGLVSQGNIIKKIREEQEIAAKQEAKEAEELRKNLEAEARQAEVKRFDFR